MWETPKTPLDAGRKFHHRDTENTLRQSRNHRKAHSKDTKATKTKQSRLSFDHDLS